MFVLNITGLSLAADKGNSRKGKYTYRTIYEQCHEKGKVDTKKPPISPDEKTQAQWQRLFDKKDFSFTGSFKERVFLFRRWESIFIKKDV